MSSKMLELSSRSEYSLPEVTPRRLSMADKSSSRRIEHPIHAALIRTPLTGHRRDPFLTRLGCVRETPCDQQLLAPISTGNSRLRGLGKNSFEPEQTTSASASNSNALGARKPDDLGALFSSAREEPSTSCRQGGPSPSCGSHSPSERRTAAIIRPSQLAEDTGRNGGVAGRSRTPTNPQPTDP